MLSRVEEVWVRMAAELSFGEKVHINVAGEAMEARARALFQNSGGKLDNIFFHPFPTDDAWIRDHGPIFVLKKEGGSIALIDWDYNSWGGKYPPFDRDNEIPARVAAYLNLDSLKPGMVLEGGSIEVNGQNTLLTTESCLLNPNRNASRSRENIEAALKKFLGAEQILWLGDGIVGDDTDGHIDDIARFVDSGTILCALEDDPRDENYRPLQENYRRLQSFTNPRGKPFRILTLPMPQAVYEKEGRLPASYANFYIGNEVVLVPVFQDPRDQEALAILAELFPTRRVVGIDSRELVVGLGGIHCVTQQQPLLLPQQLR
jgi:agmatine deiminase